MYFRSLPKEYINRGFAIGCSGNINNDCQGDNSKLWNTIGNVSYTNTEKNLSLAIPLITGFNKGAWCEFADDLVWTSGKVKKAIQPIWSTPAPESQVNLNVNLTCYTDFIGSIVYSDEFCSHEHEDFDPEIIPFAAIHPIIEHGYDLHGTELTYSSNYRWWNSHAMEGLAKYGLPFADWGIHVGLEYMHGYDIPDSIVRGTIKTGIVIGTYDFVYGSIAASCGGPIAWGCAGLALAGEFMPDYSADGIKERIVETKRYVIEGGPFPAFVVDKNVSAICMMFMKPVLTAPRLFTECAFETFDETFPSVIPAISGSLRYQHERNLNDYRAQAIRANNILKFFGINPLYDRDAGQVLRPDQILKIVELDNALKRVEKELRKTGEALESYKNK